MRRFWKKFSGVACALVLLLSSMSVTVPTAAASVQHESRQPADPEPTRARARLFAEGNGPVEIHTLDSLRFEPATIVASPGQEVRVINDGSLEHSFVIEELDIGTEVLASGDEQTLIVPADAEPGEYTFHCSLPGHRMAGMEGTLTIVEAAIPEPTPPVPAASGDPLFTANGIDATILAQAGIAPVDSRAELLMELLEVAPGSKLDIHHATSSELFYMLSGVLTFEDNFGFASVVDAGQVVSLNTGTEYTIANTENEAGRVMRLRVNGGVTATPGATPVARESEGTTVLMQAPLDDVEMDGAQMYFARAHFGPNTDSGEQQHAGPLGIYVDSGMLNVVSPSGLVGAIEAGRAVSLPAETPLQASTGETEAVVFIAGIAGSEDEPFAEISTGPDQSEKDITEPDTVLEGGRTWRVETVDMSVDFIQLETSVKFNITYVNTSDATVEFSRTAGEVRVTDDAGGTERFPSSDCPRRDELEPGESFTCAYIYSPSKSTRSDPLMVTFIVDAFGDIKNASWQQAIEW